VPADVPGVAAVLDVGPNVVHSVHATNLQACGAHRCGTHSKKRMFFLETGMPWVCKEVQGLQVPSMTDPALAVADMHCWWQAYSSHCLSESPAGPATCAYLLSKRPLSRFCW
jgi:hypothetical protein